MDIDNYFSQSSQLINLAIIPSYSMRGLLLQYKQANEAIIHLRIYIASYWVLIQLTSEPKQSKKISHQQCINSMVFYLKPSAHMDLVVLKKAANAVYEFHKLSQEITPKYFASYFDWLH